MNNIDYYLDLEKEGIVTLLDETMPILPDWSCFMMCITITFKPSVFNLCGQKNIRLYNYFLQRCKTYLKKKHVELYLVPELHESGVLHFHGYIVSESNEVARKRTLGWLRRNFGYIKCERKRSNWDKYIWKEYINTFRAYRGKLSYANV